MSNFFMKWETDKAEDFWDKLESRGIRLTFKSFQDFTFTYECSSYGTTVNIVFESSENTITAMTMAREMDLPPWEYIDFYKVTITRNGHLMWDSDPILQYEGKWVGYLHNMHQKINNQVIELEYE